MPKETATKTVNPPKTGNGETKSYTPPPPPPLPAKSQPKPNIEKPKKP